MLILHARDTSSVVTKLRHRDTAVHRNVVPGTLIDWGLWGHRGARVFSRDNVEVSPYPGRIGSHLRTKNPSIHLQLQQPGNQDGDPPGRYRPAGCGNPNSGYTIVDWGSRSQRTTPNGCKESSKFIDCYQILSHLHLIMGVVVRSTWISMYDLRLTKPKNKKQGARSASIFALVIQ